MKRSKTQAERLLDLDQRLRNSTYPNRQMLEVKYRNWKGEKTSRVAPVHLANLQGDWYLFVQYEGFDNFRQIALGRIQDVKLLSKKADIQGAFDPKKELADTFSKFAGENKPFQVTVQFHPEIAVTVLERQWHPEQKVTLKSNAGLWPTGATPKSKAPSG